MQEAGSVIMPPAVGVTDARSAEQVTPVWFEPVVGVQTDPSWDDEVPWSQLISPNVAVPLLKDALERPDSSIVSGASRLEDDVICSRRSYSPVPPQALETGVPVFG